MENKIISIKGRIKKVTVHILHIVEKEIEIIKKIHLSFATIEDIYQDIQYSKIDIKLLEPERAVLLDAIEKLEEYLKKLENQYKDQLIYLTKYKKVIKAHK
ncbi:MAG: hypothetical protein AB8V23_00860 [Candidatus Midichloria sp.]|nr:hypothetical protein MHYMCMPSP_00422 [Hyalomma marginatum]